MKEILKRFALLISRELKNEVELLRERNKDLDHELREYMIARPMTREQWVDMERIVKEHTSMQEQEAEIGKFIRENYKEEIIEGRHNGRSLSQVVIGYMMLERRISAGHNE